MDNLELQFGTWFRATGTPMNADARAQRFALLFVKGRGDSELLVYDATQLPQP
ncbi:MAG: hypothetical protein H6597_00575 [Flavobacteriales bacterium]|nr:hypothetical protein [Flavobacteriales bacterium]